LDETVHLSLEMFRGNVDVAHNRPKIRVSKDRCQGTHITAARLGEPHCKRMLRSINNTRPAVERMSWVGTRNTAKDGLEVLPVEAFIRDRQAVRLSVPVACLAYLLYPFAKRQLQLAIDQIAHVNGSIRQVVLHVVQLVEKPPAVRLGDARAPGFIPGSD